MIRRTAALALLAVGLALAPQPARAALTFEDDAPRVFAIQQRPFRLGHEFQLGLGVLPLDAFYVGAVANASYTYHFSDFWAWEIAGGGYSQNFGTGLTGKLLRTYGVAPARGGGERVNVVASTSAVVKPLFGKLTLFNEDVIYAETFFTLGLGPLLKGDYWRFAANVGIGFRFWSSRSVSVRFDVRDYLIFSGLVPESALLVSLSAAFNYYDRPEDT